MDRCLIGLIGCNILKSLSPALHEDAFAAAGIKGHYHLMDLDVLGDRTDFAHLFEAVRIGDLAGTNVTHPFKEAVIALLDDMSEEAKQIGAVNTVVVGRDGRTHGYNTDRVGFRRSFEETIGAPAVAGQRAAVIGAGGAGRAIAFALIDLGAANIAIYDRDRERAQNLAAELSGYFPTMRCEAADDVAGAVRGSVGAANASPTGMLGYAGTPIPDELISGNQWIADAVYTPLETQLITNARRKGCAVMTGGGMCVHQAAEAFRLFTGIAPDIARMHDLFTRVCAARDAKLAAA
jgi:quinate/shikimate dehydrogenase (NAD+)